MNIAHVYNPRLFFYAKNRPKAGFVYNISKLFQSERYKFLLNFRGYWKGGELIYANSFFLRDDAFSRKRVREYVYFFDDFFVIRNKIAFEFGKFSVSVIARGLRLLHYFPVCFFKLIIYITELVVYTAKPIIYIAKLIIYIAKLIIYIAKFFVYIIKSFFHHQGKVIKGDVWRFIVVWHIFLFE